MKSEKWKTVRLKDLTTDGKGHYGIGAPAVEYKKNLYAYLRITDITDDGRINRDNLMSVDHPDAKKYLLKENDIVFARTGNSTGRSYFYDKRDGELVYAGFLIKFNLDPEKVNPKYIKLYTMTKEYKNWINSVATGSTRKNINAKMYGDMEIKLPPRQYQDYVVYTVEPLNEKIENNIQMIKTLERIAQVIFKHWFIDFEFPNENGEPYKSSGGEMVESEIGLIPKDWEIKSLDEIADFLNGLAMQKYRPQKGEKGIPVLKIRELRQGHTDKNSDICSENIDEDYIVEDGDVIFSWSGSLLVDIWCGGKCGLNQHLFKVTSKEYEKWFYYYWTKYHLDRFIHIAEAKATTMGHIRRKDLADSKVLIPTRQVYEKANNILKPIVGLQINLKIQSRKLEKMKYSLLPKLMSGEIRVPIESE